MGSLGGEIGSYNPMCVLVVPAATRMLRRRWMSRLAMVRSGGLVKVHCVEHMFKLASAANASCPIGWR